MNDTELLKLAIKIYGEEKQELKAVEECSELITAISHKHFNREHNIAEEIADVEIMLEQLKIINNCDGEVEEIRQQKLDRLYEKVFNTCL